MIALRDYNHQQKHEPPGNEIRFYRCSLGWERRNTLTIIQAKLFREIQHHMMHKMKNHYLSKYDLCAKLIWHQRPCVGAR